MGRNPTMKEPLKEILGISGLKSNRKVDIGCIAVMKESLQ